MLRTLVYRGGIVILAAFLLIQLVPYGRNHTNPSVQSEPAWDSQQTRTLTERACYDCHSNETQWPAYSYVAPASWLLQRDVEEGRAELNFSEWNRQRLEETEELTEPILEGSMPPGYYVVVHPSSNLTPDEKSALVQGLRATTGQSGPAAGEEEHEEFEDDD